MKKVLCVVVIGAVLALSGCRALSTVLTAPQPTVNSNGEVVVQPDPFGEVIREATPIAQQFGLPGMAVGLGLSVLGWWRQRKNARTAESTLAVRNQVLGLLIEGIDEMRNISPEQKASWKNIVQQVAARRSMSVQSLSAIVEQLKLELASTQSS